MKVLLIGCGMNGGAIAKSLLDKKIVNKVGLYSRTIKSSKALAFDLHNSNVNVLEHLEDLKDFDYVIISLSGISDSDRIQSFNTNKTSYHVRQDELKYNLGAVAGLVPYLHFLPKSTPIIVVTNPVDEIVNYLRIALNRKNILGFGMELDVRRYSGVLGKGVDCVGVHGMAVPVINASSNKEAEDLYKKSDLELMNYLRRNGIPHGAAGDAFAEFFRRLTSKSKEVVNACYYLDKKFYDISGISISLPFIATRGKIIGVSKVNLNSIEKKRFKKVAFQLKRSVQHILVTSKKLVAYK